MRFWKRFVLVVASQSGLMFSHYATPPADEFFWSRNYPKIVVGVLTELIIYPKQLKFSIGEDKLADILRASGPYVLVSWCWKYQGKRG